MPANRLHYLLFLVLIGIEIALTTYIRGKWLGYHANGVLHLLTGITIGILAMRYAFLNKNTDDIKPIKIKNRLINLQGFEKPCRFINSVSPQKLYLVFFACIAVCFLYFLNEITRIPITPRESDIIPQIRTLNQRLLNGEFPYQPIQSFTAYMFPTYMPMMWLPYILPYVLGFDERLLAFGFWALAYFLFFKTIIKTPVSVLHQIISLLLPVILFIGFANTARGTFGHSIELMNAAFYIVLCLVILKIPFRNFPKEDNIELKPTGAFLIGSAIALCLLSRYALVLWVPLFLCILFFKNKSQALKTGGWIAFWLIIVYVLPFYLKDTTIFRKGIQYHNAAALDIWLRSAHMPGGLKEGLGVASLFSDFASGYMSKRLLILQNVHFITSFSSVIICFVIWLIYHKRTVSVSLFALGSLKLYLAFFYGFIQAPYLYLFLVPCSVSVVLYLGLVKSIKNTLVTEGVLF